MPCSPSRPRSSRCTSRTSSPARRRAGPRSWPTARGGLVVQSPPNIRSLTGFTGSAGLCVVRPEGTTLVTDFRYAVQAPQESATVARVEIDQVNVWDRLLALLAGGSGDPLGFEAHIATVGEAERLAT